MKLEKKIEIEVVNEDNLNDAMIIAQDNIGVVSGDVCAIYFAKFTDADKVWEDASIKERTEMLREYLWLEEQYEGLKED